MPPMGSLLVITGPPGAGKSATAAHIAHRRNIGVVVAGDSFFAFLADGAIDPWRSEAHAQNGIVIEAAGSATGRFVLGGYHTIYEGVLGPWFLPRFADAASIRNLDYVILLPPVEACLQRVRTRLNHGFGDEAATRRLHRDFAEAEIAPRHVVAAAAGSSAGVADLVIEGWRDRTFRYERP